MDIESMNLEAILGMAVKTETLGRQFYLNLSEKIGNDDVRRKILGLADDEKRHQEIMENLYRKMLGKDPTELPAKGVPDIIRAIAALKVSDKTQVLDVLDMAIEAESIATKFYQRGAAIAADNKTRIVFEELQREEEAHYNYLVSEKNAITADYYWFSISDTAAMEE
jgi:rubrerythrin